MPSPRYPLFAGLLVAGVRHDVLECSVAGLSVARAVANKVGLQGLQRGDRQVVTLCVGGSGWQTSYDLEVRLAAEGPAHLGLAFVALPSAARRTLERYETESQRARGLERVFDTESGGPAPFAFSRLAEPDQAPSRRFVLPDSAAVFALTRTRSGSHTASDSVRGSATTADTHRVLTPPTKRAKPAPRRAAFAWGVGLFAAIVALLFSLLS